MVSWCFGGWMGYRIVAIELVVISSDEGRVVCATSIVGI